MLGDHSIRVAQTREQQRQRGGDGELRRKGDRDRHRRDEEQRLAGLGAPAGDLAVLAGRCGCARRKSCRTMRSICLRARCTRPSPGGSRGDCYLHRPTERADESRGITPFTARRTPAARNAPPASAGRAGRPRGTDTAPQPSARRSTSCRPASAAPDADAAPTVSSIGASARRNSSTGIRCTRSTSRFGTSGDARPAQTTTGVMTNPDRVVKSSSRPRTWPASTTRPTSPANSRSAAASGVSPASIRPPSNAHCRGGCAERANVASAGSPRDRSIARARAGRRARRRALRR